MEHTAEALDALNPGYEGLLGYGRVNAGEALTTNPMPLIDIVGMLVNGDPLGRPTPGESSTLEITLSNDWLAATGVTAVLSSDDPYVTITQGTADYGDLVPGGSAAGSPVYTFDVALGAGYDHPMDFTLAVSANGGAYTTEIDFTIKTRSAEELVGGTIAANTTWTNDKTYVVTSNLGVAPGYTLTIQPGTTVEFNTAISLSVGGTLIADGLEEQPIRFISHDGGSWGPLKFDDSSVDAVADVDGNYLSGNILHWVVVQGGSIQMYYATPYLSQLTQSTGSLMGILGATPLWLVDSHIQGDIMIQQSEGMAASDQIAVDTYAAYVLRVDQSHGININLPPSEVRDSTFQEGLEIYLEGTVENCSAAHIFINGSGTVQNSTVRGYISVPGSGAILNNTAGAIIVGDGSVVQGNRIDGSVDWDAWGIQTSGSATITQNRLVGNASGIQTYSGTVQDNLIANHAGVGLEINGDVSVTNNTFTGNGGNTIKIVSGAPTVQGNNLEGNTGTYDIENLTTNGILAEGNWWGTTYDPTIDLRIYDFMENYNLGLVDYAPEATGPIQTAPAYVRSVTLSPESPVGIEAVTFGVGFSRPMDTSIRPELSFQYMQNNTWFTYDTSNSGLPSNDVRAIASDPDGAQWIGMNIGVAHFSGMTWTIYDTSNSGLPGNYVDAIATDPDGSHWFGTTVGVAYFDGMNWTEYLPGVVITSIARDADGSHWFGTWFYGIEHFDGTTWTVYNTSNSELPDNDVTAIATDPDCSVWFGTYSGGVAHFDGTDWTVYDTTNSGIQSNRIYAIATDPDGSHWFGGAGGVSHFDGVTWSVYTLSYCTTPGGTTITFGNSVAMDEDGSYWFGSNGCGVVKFDGLNWTEYTTENSGLPSNVVVSITKDVNGSLWFGSDAGVGVLWNYRPNPIQDSPRWLDETHFQATYDITSLIPRGDYRITVAGALDPDGIEIAPNSNTTFTVDYAGGVSDTSAPPAPHVTACAGLAVGDLSASWTASDPDSAITLYQYAIGTTPGGAEVINWTSTSAASFDLHGLSLNAGQLYYVSVKARNEGGLWSVAATAPGVAAGSDTCALNLVDVYLPLVKKK